MKPSRFASGHFRDAGTQWAVSADDSATDVAAAWLQFQVARLVWEQAERGKLDTAVLAEQLGQSFEAQRKKLSGDQPAALRDFVGWLMAVGEPAYGILPRSDTDLFPQAALPLLAGWQSGRGQVATFRTPVEPDWSRLATELAADVTAIGHGVAHLLTSDWLRQRAVEHLTGIGIAPSQLRLWSPRDVTALQVGVLRSALVAFEWVNPVEAASVDTAAAVVWRLRSSLRTVAINGQPGMFVAAASSPLAAALLAEALSAPDTDGDILLGPFEADHRDSNTLWWAGHHVIARQLTQREVSDTSLTAIYVSKAVAM